MTKRFVLIGAAILAVLAAIAFFTIRSMKPQVIAAPAPQAQAPVVDSTPVPEPVVEVPKSVVPEKPVLTVQDPGGRLLVDDWSSFTVNPFIEGKSLDSIVMVGHLNPRDPIYAPFRGYAIKGVTGMVFFVEGDVPNPKPDDMTGFGKASLVIYNVSIKTGSFEQFEAGQKIGVIADHNLNLYRDKLNGEFNVLIAPAREVYLARFKGGGTDLPHDIRKVLLIIISEARLYHHSLGSTQR